MTALVLLLFLTLCSGFFSLSETALFSLTPTTVQTYESSSNLRKQLIARLLAHPRDLLVTIFMLNTLANILLQNTVSHMFEAQGGWLLKIGVPFVIMLIFGEIIPKYIGLKNNVALADRVAPIIDFSQKLLKPARRFIIAVTAPISRMLFFFLRKEESISKDELQYVLKKSEDYGVLYHEEAEIISGYFNLQDAIVKELMQPRDHILYYDTNDPLSQLIHQMVDLECSRLPVCNGSLDDVLGIMAAHDFFLYRQHIQTSQDLLKYIKKPLYIPESTAAQVLLRRFGETDQVLALVVDEYGSITGLITREDLVEVVIGEISDLRDMKDLYVQASQTEIMANGRLELDEFNKLFHSELKSEHNMLTIGGWLTEQLGDIPKSGTKYDLHGFRFQVLAADPNRILRLYITKITS